MTPNHMTNSDMLKLMGNFNEAHRIGQAVAYQATPDSKPEIRYTESDAFMDMQSNEPCVMLKGFRGAFPLSKLKIAEQAPPTPEKPSRFVTTASGYEIDLKAVVAAKKQHVMAPNKETDFKWWPQVAGLVIVGAIHLKSEEELDALHEHWKRVRLDD